MNIVGKNTKESDITLLDLIAVVIRRRKIVLFTTLSFFVAGVFLFFVKPSVSSSNNTTNIIDVVYTANVEPLNVKLEEYLNIHVNALAGKNMNDYMNFARVQKKYNIFTTKDMNERSYNTVIKDLFIKGKFKIDLTNPSNIKIVAQIPESKSDEYKKFLEDYVLYCSSLIEDIIEGLISTAEKNINEVISKYDGIEKSSTDISSLISMQLEFQNFRNSHKQFISLSGDCFETTAAKGRLKKLFIFILFGFFISLVLAFFINFVSNVKEDPEASKIISDAWKAGK